MKTFQEIVKESVDEAKSVTPDEMLKAGYEKTTNGFTNKKYPGYLFKIAKGKISFKDDRGIWDTLPGIKNVENVLKNFAKESVDEAKDAYKVYHDTYTSAIQEVEKFVKSKKYMLDKEEMASEVGMGPPKPGAGKTNRFTLKLYKDVSGQQEPKLQKKAVHFQVYGMGNTKDLGAKSYELNVYIS